MAPLPVGLSDYWTIAMFNILYQGFYIFPWYNTLLGLSDYWTIAIFDILYQDFYIFPMCNKTTWTIGLLDNCSILCSLSILLHIY